MMQMSLIHHLVNQDIHDYTVQFDFQPALPSDVTKICLLQLNNMGDIISTSATVRLLRQHYRSPPSPGGHLGLFCRSE